FSRESVQASGVTNDLEVIVRAHLAALEGNFQPPASRTAVMSDAERRSRASGQRHQQLERLDIEFAHGVARRIATRDHHPPQAMAPYQFGQDAAQTAPDSVTTLVDPLFGCTQG